MIPSRSAWRAVVYLAAVEFAERKTTPLRCAGFDFPHPGGVSYY